MHLRSIIVGLACVGLVACGGSGEKSDSEPSGPQSAALRQQLAQATATKAADFPATKGRTLQAMADSLDGAGPETALAGTVFTPGTNRVAFGVIDRKSGFVYAPTAVYVAPSPGRKAQGPFPAPADLLITDGPYRSQQAAAEDGPIAAIYEAQVPFVSTGQWEMLTVSKINGKLIGSPSVLKVIPPAKQTVPAVGESAPKTSTDTVASARGKIEDIDTRLPADDMHRTDFAEVRGKKPVALLFATPQLCESRVCGPVVDIALQLKQTYGDQMEFIHQEVYVDNKVERGLRTPLRQFGLPTEPWLFVIGKDGKLTARLEGSFGLRAFERAIKTAL